LLVDLLLVLGVFAISSSTLAAAANPALDKAQKDAEAKGYLFVRAHDEIVNKAKQEGKLRVIVSTDATILKHLSAGFRKEYPFIDIRTDEIRGNEVFLRMIQEMKAGLTKGQDVNDLAYDYYNEYPPYLKKFDILGMAEQKVLQIPVQMVDPINRNVVAMGSGIQVVAYNKKLIATEKVPDTWEGFLRPEFKDRKFVLDIRPKDVSALVPAWGLEKTLDFARKIAAQKPVWARGNVRVLTAMLAGEHALHDLHVFLEPRDGTPVGDAVPAFDHLRAGGPEPQDEAPAREGVQRHRRHRGHRRRAGRHLHDRGA